MKTSYWIAIAAIIAAAGLYYIFSATDREIAEAAPGPAEAVNGNPELQQMETSSGFITPQELAGESPPAGADRQFRTDFSIHSISYAEVLSGGPPKDGIPAIDDPQFDSISEADEWLRPLEPVVFMELNGEARAYPIQILVWHEIVNDTLGDVPVAVTFCPLCNTAIAFDRRVGDQVFDFGTTGRLRLSNLIMYDRQTENWWQQASGEAIAGSLTGTRLKFLPAQLIAWQDFKAAHPDSLVLSRRTGFNRSYGNNPYAGYDDINNSPFLFRGQTDGTLPPMARVLTVEINEAAAAYPYDLLTEIGVANDLVGGEPLVVFWAPGTESAFQEAGLDNAYADIGTANSFSAVVDGRPLTFSANAAGFVDDQTGSQWNILGEAESGELAGTQLEPVVGINHFWFSWAAFRPDTVLYQASSGS